VNGEIYDMAGGTAAHNRITVNLTVAIENTIRRTKKPCSVFATDMRVHIKKANAYTFPDVLIVCGKLEFDEGRHDVILNPIVIFEVLSDSTREHDHTRKFQMYRKLASLQEYVLVEQNQASVECFRRIESGLWVFEGYESIKQTLKLKSVEFSIPLSTIYENVELSSDE
jgi:Uma2 family endonuclease